MTSVRKTVPRDASAVLRLAAAEPLFSRDDREVVEELLFDYLEETEPGDYRYLTAIDDGRVVGFACYGPTPLTHGTFDLYWICVSRRQRRKGTGLALLRGVIRGVRREGGRLVVLDTSARRDFGPTRAFYEAAGFQPSARVPGFYGRGDDLMMYYFPVRNPRKKKGKTPKWWRAGRGASPGLPQADSRKG
jgi:GNAT superfamily N-acetyltransferase